MRTRVKFCGCTSAADALAAVDCGADAIGVILVDASPRCVSIDTARSIARTVPPFVTLVSVFVEPSFDLVTAALAAGYLPQFSGNEPASTCEAVTSARYIKVRHVEPGTRTADDVAAFNRAADEYARATWMFDTTVEGKHGGTGRSFDWSVARELAGDRQIIMSGGLHAQNVGQCIRTVRPYGVDVRSGIETGGVKDRTKMRAFVRAVKEADGQA